MVEEKERNAKGTRNDVEICLDCVLGDPVVRYAILINVILVSRDVDDRRDIVQ